MPGPKAARPAPRGALIDVGGRRLHVVRAGPAAVAPLILLEAGSFGFSVDWAVVQERLAARGLRSLAYDRAGLGHSDLGPSPRDGLAIAADLEALLQALGETGPLVLVGHSMAGLHIRLFALRNRPSVGGLVLVDAATPEMARARAARQAVGLYQRFADGVAAAAAVSLLTPFAGLGDTIGLQREPARHKRWAFADPGHNRVAAEEVRCWQACVAQGLDAGSLDPAWPVAVVTAGAERSGAGRKSEQAAPALASRAGFVRHIPGAGHATLLGPRFADAIVEGVEHVLKACALGVA